jgi:hypothetical protein
MGTPVKRHSYLVSCLTVFAQALASPALCLTGFWGGTLVPVQNPPNSEGLLKPPAQQAVGSHRAKGRLQSTAAPTKTVGSDSFRPPLSPSTSEGRPQESPRPNLPGLKAQLCRLATLFFLKWGATGAILKSGWSLNRPKARHTTGTEQTRNRHKQDNRKHQDKWARLTPPPQHGNAMGRAGQKNLRVMAELTAN